MAPVVHSGDTRSNGFTGEQAKAYGGQVVTDNGTGCSVLYTDSDIVFALIDAICSVTSFETKANKVSDFMLKYYSALELIFTFKVFSCHHQDLQL
jgi:hypothetical protein